MDFERGHHRLTAVETDRRAKPEELPKIDPRFKTRTSPPQNFYRFVVLCFDRATGKQLWETPAPHEKLEEIHRIGSHAQCSPATDGERVVVFFGSSGLFCYDADGKLQWQHRMGPFKNDFGAGTRLHHWRETVLDAELMTGFIENNASTPMPLSIITVQAMADIGYQVDPSKADPYNAALRAETPMSERIRLNTVIGRARYRITPDGTIIPVN